jgi:signal transduction histidine kinase
LETLDVARVHERALAALETSASKDGFIGRADIFFTEAIAPIEETHGVALEASARLRRLKTALTRRTMDLAASNRSLKKGIAQRKTAEGALKKSVRHYQTLLRESLALQKHLHRLTRRLLAAHEDKRQQIRHELQDEIAQTLLGINVRLVTVKKTAGRNAKSLQKELASTQRLVDMSLETIKRFAREYGKLHEP